MQNTIVAAYPDPENGGHITYVWSHGAEVWQEEQRGKRRDAGIRASQTRKRKAAVEAER